MSLKTLIETVTTNAASDENILNKAYDDLIHPAAQNVGQALGTLTSTLDIFLAPCSWAVYGFKYIDVAVKTGLTKILSDTPIENLSEPESNIVIPAYEALRYSLDKESLKEMYINLIASSMLNDKKDKAHPAFVEVIKQLSPFDAEFLKILFYKKPIQIPKIKVRLQISSEDTIGIDIIRTLLSPKYFNDKALLNDYSFTLDNFERLKIIEINDSYFLSGSNMYEDIIESVDKDSFLNLREELNYVNLIKGSISLTNFGKQFVDSVF